MPTLPETFQTALQYHQAGRLPEAEALYRQVLQAHPDHHEALYRLGLVACQTGRHDDAVEYIGRALRLNPGAAEYHNNIGTAYKALGKLEEAVAHYRQALALRPAYAMAHNSLGATLGEQGKLEEAIVHYRQALALQPDYAEAYNNLGSALKAQGKLEEAVVHYRQALTLRPAYAMAHNNLGTALSEQGKLEEAVVHYRQALAHQPAFAEAFYNLGNVLKEQGKVEEAIVQYRQALALRPAYAMAHNNLGNALKEQFKLDEAVAHYWQALAVQPDYADVYNNLGIVLRDQGKHEEATACYRQALAIRPDYVVANSNLLFDMSYASGDAEQIGHEYRKWNDRHARHLALQGTAHANNRNPARRLRVGYVSADFLKHSVSYFMEPLLSAHDHGNVEVFCYSNSRHSDATTARLQKLAGAWRDISGMTDGAVADLIVADAIDILVDLSGHTAGNRLLVFARKPAPVQVTYLGYGATTGLSTMDYRLTDEYLSPADSSEWHSEELVRLPGCYVCYRPPADSPPVAPAPVVTAGHVTIGSFNNLAKVTPAVVGVWAEILRSLPAARLILKDRTLADEGQQARFRVLFAKEGVGADRIEFISLIADPLEHLACYGRVDIGLDPFPYNGCTTTCEALWMGVPVITLAGRLSHGRYGVSLLTALKMDDFSAATPADYVAKAVGLANDPERLAKLRSALRPRMAGSLLCDAESFARKIEQAYRQMWSRWCLSR